MKMNNKILMSISFIMILIISIFTAINFSEISSISTRANSNETDEELFVKIYADEYSGSVPHYINFKPLVIGSNGNVKYSWDFGDGEKSKEEKPTHVYNEEGTYNCKLIVDDGKHKRTDSVNITVGPNNPPEVKILVDDTIVYRPISMNFDAQAHDIDGEIVSYEWLIQQPKIGPYIPEKKFNKKSFKLKTLDMWRKGEYHVTLKVTDDSGNVAKDHIRITVNKGKIGSLWDWGKSQIRSCTFLYGQVGDGIELLITIGIWTSLYNFVGDIGIDAIVQLMDLLIQIFSK